MNEDKGTRYQRMRRRTAALAAGWTLALPALLVAMGAGRAVCDWLASFTAGLAPPLAAPVVAVVLAAILILLHEAGLFPILFGRYVIDRRYGVTRESAGVWLAGHLKSVGLGAVVSLASAWLVYVCLVLWPGVWWVVAWAAATAGTVGVVWATPVWILPRFYRLTPVANPRLVERLGELARQAGVPAAGVFEWQLGAHTRRATAVLAGIGRSRRILLSDTLLRDYTEAEIEVVLAHELAHQASHDVRKTLAAESILTACTLLLADTALTAFWRPLGLTGRVDPAGLPFLVLVAVLGAGGAVPLLHALSRELERRADRRALELTRRPDAFVSAIRRLSASNLADEDPPAWARLVFYSHPPVAARLDLARDWVRRSEA